MALNDKRLDKKRPYGDVVGQVEGIVGARYSQDNCLFDAAGVLIHSFDPEPAPVVEAAPVAEVAPPAPPAPKTSKKDKNQPVLPPGLPAQE